MPQKTLEQIVIQKPFPDYAGWWPMGVEFLSFMSTAIITEWLNLPHNDKNLTAIQDDLSYYISLVYGREARPTLVQEFFDQAFSQPIYSGQFDALSYAYFKAAFALIGQYPQDHEHAMAQERRLFTKRVGRRFFQSLQNHLELTLPTDLTNNSNLAHLKNCIAQIGNFLKVQGYLRDHFAFLFTLELEHAGRRLSQTEADALANLQSAGLAYALYEMGYPAILPSAVYLYQTVGEAQHHSSRTIEELFDQIGYEARETDDFDPTAYPSNRVVELWEIKRVSPI